MSFARFSKTLGGEGLLVKEFDRSKNGRRNSPSMQIRLVKRILSVERFIGSIRMRRDGRSRELAKFRSRNCAARADIGSGTESDVDITARRTGILSDD